MRLHEEDGLSYAQIAEQLGIRKAARIEAWYRAYRREGELAFHKPIGRPRKDEAEQEPLGALADGECAAKKIPYRVAQSYAREAQYRVIEHYREGIPGEWDVYLLRDFASCLLCLAASEWIEPDRDAERKKLILEAYEASKRTYGYRRIELWLRQKRALVINHKAVLRLMNRLGIHSVARKRKIYRKMSQLDIYHRYENLLNREFHSHSTQSEVGHRYHLYGHPAGLGLSLDHQRPV